MRHLSDVSNTCTVYINGQRDGGLMEVRAIDLEPPAPNPNPFESIKNLIKSGLNLFGFRSN